MAPAVLTMAVIAAIGVKGGVGKTTVAANLCTTLAQAGRSVPAPNPDPQNALRFHLATDREARRRGPAEDIAQCTHELLARLTPT